MYHTKINNEMSKVINLESEVTLTVNQLMTIFKMGREFESQVIAYDTDEIEVITSPDFDDTIDIVLNLKFAENE